MAYPDLILDYLLQKKYLFTLPGFIELDETGIILNLSDNMSDFEIPPLEKGTLLSDKLPFFEGLIPLTTPTLVLPNMQISSDYYLDIHLIQGIDTTWILLSDTGINDNSMRELLQRWNETKYLDDRYQKLKDDIICGKMIDTLEIVLFENLGEGRFQPLRSIPSWFTQLLGPEEAQNSVILLAERFPFIDHFIYNSPSISDESNQQYRRSEIWTEILPDSEEIHLYIHSLQIEDRNYLYIERIRELIENKTSLMQLAREKSLDFEKLKKTEQILREKEARLKIIIDHIPALLWTTDLELSLNSLNGTQLYLIGGEGKYWINKSVDEIFPEDQFGTLPLEGHRMALQGVSSSFELSVLNKTLLFYLDFMTDENEKIYGVVGFSFDITELKTAEENRTRVKLIEARAEAMEQANRELKREVDARVKAETELQSSLIRMETILHNTIRAMSLTIEKRDPYTAGHQRRVAELAAAIASEMGLSEETIEVIRLAGTIHDLGKVIVPAEILSKPGRLSQAEFMIIQLHPQTASEILSPIEFPWPIAQIVHQHHEKLDGSGYPLGLTSDCILIEAKIICVADVVEAITNFRPYRPSLGIDKALQEINRWAGEKFDSRAVEACTRLFKEKGFIFS